LLPENLEQGQTDSPPLPRERGPGGEGPFPQDVKGTVPAADGQDIRRHSAAGDGRFDKSPLQVGAPHHRAFFLSGEEKGPGEGSRDSAGQGRRPPQTAPHPKPLSLGERGFNCLFRTSFSCPVNGFALATLPLSHRKGLPREDGLPLSPGRGGRGVRAACLATPTPHSLPLSLREGLPSPGMGQGRPPPPGHETRSPANILHTSR